MFDWQAVIVALIICAAFAYTVRRGLARLGSFRARDGNGGMNDASCATGCGSCGGGEKKTRATAMPAKVLVQIERTTNGRPR